MTFIVYSATSDLNRCSNLKEKNKDETLERFGAALHKAMKAQKIPSVTKLYIASDNVDLSELRRFFRGETEPGLLKIISIANGLGISFSQLAKYYDELTDEDIQSYRKKLAKNSKKGRDQTKKVKPKPPKKKN